MFCWHKWSLWSKIFASYRGHKMQSRVCKKCGKLQFKDHGYQNGSSVIDINRAITEAVGKDEV
jgi:hypothetical protein